jgi:hypothetical protein
VVERIAAPARRALAGEATRLTAWLGGFRVPTIYQSPVMKGR